MSALEKLKEYVESMKWEGLTGYALSIENLLSELQDKPEPRKEDPTDIELRENCERIREMLEEFADGKLYDLETGDMVNREDIEDEDGFIDDERYQDFYQYYVLDNLGIKVMHDVQSPDELYACRICVAWGGPNIYIDTYTECVEGYWGYSGRASVAFSKDVTEMIDNEVEHLMEYYR